MSDVTKLSTELSDEDLMKEYQNGNEMAFTMLYERHSPKVYGFLLNKLRDRAFADDVFQAVFLKLHQTRSKYNPAHPFTPWLFSICKSSMIDALRKKARIHEESNSDAVDLAIAPQAAQSPTLPSFDSLSENQRQVLELRYAHDLTFEQIARKLETTPLNVRQITSRAIRKLQGLVGKEKING